uniref:Uncharacterized protein n=1 Tax=Knipowitschia caucasica TaxID=637954 RepID=A0AAV2LA50_KNICA
MNSFEKIKDADEFTGDFLDKQLILFTCLNIIEEELIAHLWNTHIIRKTRNAVAPCGRPHMMYTLPQIFEVKSQNPHLQNRIKVTHSDIFIQHSIFLKIQNVITDFL